MNLDLLTDGEPDTKPWLPIVCDSVDCLRINSKYPATASDNSWNGALAVVPTVISNALPVGTGGNVLSHSTARNEVVLSGLAGANTAAVTTDGVVWAQVISPTTNTTIMWSPTLNLYSAIDGAGTAVYTTPDLVVYTIGTPFPSVFQGGDFFWSDLFNKFLVGSVAAGNRICDSVDGKNYIPRVATRNVQGFAESKSLGRIVGVGDLGAQYSDDGVVWTNVTQVFSAADVDWSDTYGCFVTVPRLGTRTECWRSKDGITWTVTTPFSGLVNIRTMTWSQDMGLFFAGGDGSYVAFSMDGLTWRRAIVPGAVASYASIYVREWGQYILGGISLFVLTNGPRFRIGV
jgi:hypothetical protein